MARRIFYFLILIAIIALVVFFVRRNQVSQTPEPTASPQETTKQQELQNQFRYQIPENTQKITLVDVTGGNSTGLASRIYENGIFDLVVLADLPQPSNSNYYNVYLIKQDESQDTILAGTMTQTKGGYLLEFQSGTDYSDYSTLVVSLQTPGETEIGVDILQGNF